MTIEKLFKNRNRENSGDKGWKINQQVITYTAEYKMYKHKLYSKPRKTQELEGKCNKPRNKKIHF